MDIPAVLDLPALPGVCSLVQQLSGPACTQDKPQQKQEDILGENSLPEQGMCTHEHLQTPRCSVSFRWQHEYRGHYISDVAEEEGKRWLSFSNSNVSRSNEPDILQRRARTAYLIFCVHLLKCNREQAEFQLCLCCCCVQWFRREERGAMEDGSGGGSSQWRT
ncbi:uncharacterized protein LOC143511959 isoform X2 [Brachyhypopomus gauderio]|uniref:uncharacterized protein LOC143511959 isoform X2 n=1 Tax=Brachyhypopomus gauderio TaxID=698409 RepID=UPI0040423C23